MAEKSQFIRVDSNFISFKKGTDIKTPATLGLYALISAFLSNPNMKSASYGGFKEAVIKHCSNGRYSFCASWNDIKSAGFLKRARIPFGVHQFRDYYTLLSKADKSVPEVQNLKFSEGSKYIKDKKPFLPPTSDYTEISYKLLMDSNISLTAKGLYCIIKQLLDLKNNGAEISLNKDRIRKYAKLGFRSFNTAWAQLKNYGYLSVKRIWNYERNAISYIYTLENTAAEIGTVKENKPLKVFNEPAPLKENTAPVIISPKAAVDRHTVMTVKNNIEYDVLLEKEETKEYADIILDSLISTLSLDDDAIISSGMGKLNVYEAKQRVLSLTHEEVELVCIKYNEALYNKKELKNPAGYLRALLLNAKRDFNFNLRMIEAEFA